jgi:hypothetical protein
MEAAVQPLFGQISKGREILGTSIQRYAKRNSSDDKNRYSEANGPPRRADWRSVIRHLV